jgi:hypothetical protein
VDVYVDGRPRESTDVTDGPRELSLDGCGGANVVQVQGFSGGELVAARTQAL